MKAQSCYDERGPRGETADVAHDNPRPAVMCDVSRLPSPSAFGRRRTSGPAALDAGTCSRDSSIIFC
jgi:hypothetical protein